MKIKRAFSLTLCLLLVLVILPAPTLAADTITIESVIFEPYEDTYGARDDDLVMVYITFTAPAGMSQLSILLAGADIQSVNTGNKHQVIHQDQLETPEDGMLVFPIAKARVAAATGLSDADGATLYLRLGGTGAETVSRSVIYEEPAPVYGDLNGDGKVGSLDALMILRYYTRLAPLTTRQLEAADVVQNGSVGLDDAVRILRYEAKLESILVITPQQ